MPYYKDTENKIHFLESEEFEHLLPIGSVEITESEAQEMQLQNEIPIVQVEQIDPVDKLKSFLASNPDVKELLK